MKCRKCGEEKEVEKFPKGERVCKSCKVIRAKEWKRANPEKVKASESKRRKERSEHFKKYYSQWKKNNSEKVAESNKKYREKNREEIRNRGLSWYHANKWKAREYRQKNKAQVREYARQYRQKNLEKIRERRRNAEKVYRKSKIKENWARKQVYMAIKRGDLQKPAECTICRKTGRIEAHHHDYEKPLDVLWACRLCHAGLHLILKSNG